MAQALQLAVIGDINALRSSGRLISSAPVARSLVCPFLSEVMRKSMQHFDRGWSRIKVVPAANNQYSCNLKVAVPRAIFAPHKVAANTTIQLPAVTLKSSREIFAATPVPAWFPQSHMHVMISTRSKC